MRPVEAIILAAGMGTRLTSVVDDRPKGLIVIDGESLVARSISLLRSAGIRRTTIVAGYCAEAYRAFAADARDIRILINPAFADTGSMASLAIALDACRGVDVLVLESDLAYERRALTTIVDAQSDATLTSGLTGAGDEVWVSAPNGRLCSMSKRRDDLPSVDGEFVGITALSAGTAAAMRAAFDRFQAANGHGRMDYETGALVQVAAAHAIAAPHVPDLVWGEIDDERHYSRVVERIWPAITR